jgi:hypothetical protein
MSADFYPTAALRHDQVVFITKQFLAEAQAKALITGYAYTRQTLAVTNDERFYTLPCIEFSLHSQIPHFISCPTEARIIAEPMFRPSAGLDEPPYTMNERYILYPKINTDFPGNNALDAWSKAGQPNSYSFHLLIGEVAHKVRKADILR